MQYKIKYSVEEVAEIEKILAPLVKTLNAEVREYSPDSVTGQVGIRLSATYNVITGGSWTSGSFFNEKDAKKAADMLNELEIGCASQNSRNKPEYGAKISKDTFGKRLSWHDLKELSNLHKVKVDFEELAKFNKS